MHEHDAYLTAAQAAATLQTTPLKILMLVKQGVLDGVQEHEAWLVSRASLEQLAEEGLPAAVASNCGSGCRGCGQHAAKE